MNFVVSEFVDKAAFAGFQEGAEVIDDPKWWMSGYTLGRLRGCRDADRPELHKG